MQRRLHVTDEWIRSISMMNSIVISTPTFQMNCKIHVVGGSGSGSVGGGGVFEKTNGLVSFHGLKGHMTAQSNNIQHPSTHKYYTDLHQ